MNPALDVQHISKAYGKKQAVNDVSFQIQEGEIYGLMGMNGAGKTTILRMLATLLKPDSGDALIAGHSIKTQPDLVRASICYLPDEASAYRSMTGRKYLAFIAGLYFDEEKEQVMEDGKAVIAAALRVHRNTRVPVILLSTCEELSDLAYKNGLLFVNPQMLGKK